MTKIYVSDLDGTLLRNDATISEFSRNNLTKLLNDGLNFTVASARSVTSLRQILGKIPLRLSVIEINGAFISDFHTGFHHVINAIEEAIVPDIYSAILEYNCNCFVSAFNGSEDRLYYDKINNDGMKWFIDDKTEFHDTRLTKVKNLSDSFGDMVVCLTVIEKYEVLKKLADHIENVFGERLETHFFQNPYSPQWHWLTIHDQIASKDIAIKTLIQMEGFKTTDLVVFGDNLNDVEMMKLGQLGAHTIAVENATDDIKQLAKEVIGPNEQDSVIKYILKDTKRA